MDYSQYTENSTTVKEYLLTVSDGVSLKVIDFTPHNVSPENPVILFVAGWISLLSGWKDVLKVLLAQYRILYLESREKQSSTVPDVKKASFSMQRLVLDLDEIVDQVIVPSGDFILAGSSLGATAILEYCSLDKRKALSAVLIGPNTEFRFPKILVFIVTIVHPSLYFFIKPLIKWYIRNFRLNKKNSREQIEKYENTLDCADPYKLKANALALKNYKLSDRVDQIKIPCLILGATTDTLHDTGHIKNLVNKIPAAQYVEMESNMATHSEKAGHLIAKHIKSLMSE